MLETLGNLEEIYIACGKTDLRKGIDGLAEIVELKFNLNPFSPSTLFLFCGNSKTKIKGLLWEGDGFLLLYKRLESGKYNWPRNSEEAKRITPQQYRWLLEGLSIEQKKSIKKVSYNRFT